MLAKISLRIRRAGWWRIMAAVAAGSWVFCVLGAAETAPAQAAPKPGQPLSERGTLVVGATTDSYPYGYIGTDGKWTGFGGDLLDAVARVMNLRISRVKM